VTIADRLRIAVFIDFDNIEIGVKNSIGASFDAGLVLEALKERGEVVSKTAYSDWQRAGGYSRMLTQHAIRMVQRNLTPGGDKNGADINLALDALEMALTHSHINAFVIVGGDSDFISLVEKLKQYDKKVFIVGGRQFTSGILQRNCHEFIAYENLISAGASGGQKRQPGRDDRADRVPIERAPIEQAIPLVTRGLKVLSERELSPQLGLLKSTLLQLDSTFSERSYGAGSFRDFVQRLENLGVVRLQQARGGWLVGSAEGGAPPSAAPLTGDDGEVVPDKAPGPEAAAIRPGPAQTAAGVRPPVTGTPLDAVRELGTILASAQIRRWPLYLRNVKQLIREVNPSFDERAYGLGNLVDLLRAAHKEGLVRVDRDRQGVIRVFQGAAQATLVSAPPAAVEQQLEPEQIAPPPVDTESSAETPGDNIGNVAEPAAAPKSRRRRSSPQAAGDGHPVRARRSARKPRDSG
jgi:uncharacterized LabA/DUF88 family protein